MRRPTKADRSLASRSWLKQWVWKEPGRDVNEDRVSFSSDKNLLKLGWWSHNSVHIKNFSPAHLQWVDFRAWMCSMQMLINVLQFRESGFLPFLGPLARMSLFGSLLCSEGLDG